MNMALKKFQFPNLLSQEEVEEIHPEESLEVIKYLTFTEEELQKYLIDSISKAEKAAYERGYAEGKAELTEEERKWRQDVKEIVLAVNNNLQNIEIPALEELEYIKAVTQICQVIYQKLFLKELELSYKEVIARIAKMALQEFKISSNLHIDLHERLPEEDVEWLKEKWHKPGLAVTIGKTIEDDCVITIDKAKIIYNKDKLTKEIEKFLNSFIEQGDKNECQDIDSR